MKKHVLLFCLFSNFIFAQKTITTFYDKQKLKKDEVYQVDANGTMNGSYKHFDEEGALRNEGTFKLGKKNGVFIEYTKFPNYAGKMQIKSKETYVNDMKEGPAAYYKYSKELGVYPYEAGNYVGNKESGTWTKIWLLTDNISATSYEEREAKVNEVLKNPLYKNSFGVQNSQKYQNGEKVKYTDTTVNAFYYPSLKVYSTTIWKDGKIESTQYFLPDGKLKS